MARLKTTNTPELQALLTTKTPMNPVTLAVEEALKYGRDWSASVAEQIAVRLAGLIAIDEIHAGQRLLETDISDVLVVSRAPVREALRILERERLIEFRARRGAVVTEPNADDLKDIYVVREALFAILLRELMEEKPEALDALFDELMPKLSKAVQELAVDAYASATFLANLAMAGMSRNRLVADLLNSISLRTLRYVRLGLASHPDSLESSIKTWRALQRAVAKRDIDAVLQTARKRIESSRDTAVRALTPVSPKNKAAVSRRSVASSSTA